MPDRRAGLPLSSRDNLDISAVLDQGGFSDSHNLLRVTDDNALALRRARTRARVDRACGRQAEGAA